MHNHAQTSCQATTHLLTKDVFGTDLEDSLDVCWTDGIGAQVPTGRYGAPCPRSRLETRPSGAEALLDQDAQTVSRQSRAFCPVLGCSHCRLCCLVYEMETGKPRSEVLEDQASGPIEKTLP